MNKSTKMILSLLGIGAVVVPAILLVVMTKNTATEPVPAGADRKINNSTIQDVLKKAPSPSPVIPSPLPSPTPTPTPKPIESSPSAQ